MINDADKKILDTTVVLKKHMKMQRSLRLKVKYLVSLV